MAASKDRDSDFLDNLVNTLPDFVAWQDLDGFYQGCNQAMAELLTLAAPEDIIGKRDHAFFLPDLVDSLLEKHKQVLESGRPVRFEEEVSLFDGTHKTLVFTKTPLFNDQQEKIAVLTSAVDITAYRLKDIDNAIGHLNSIVACTPGYIFWKDKEGYFLGTNDYTINNAGNIIGKTDYDLFSPEIADKLREADKRVMETRGFVSVEETGIMPDGQVRTFMAIKMPLKNEKGEVIGIVGNSHEITGLKHTQQQLEKERAETKQIKMELFQRVRNMRHDMNTPFSGILGLSEDLEQSELDMERKKQLGYVKQSAKALLKTLDTTLDTFKQSWGSLELVFSRFSVKNLINELERMMLSVAKHKQLKLVFKYDDRIPDVLIGNRMALYRLLVNLLGNAVKFTKKGYVELQVDLVHREEEKVLLRFIVRDTGRGIHKNEYSFIFEPTAADTDRFLNLDNYNNIGLGLQAIKQSINEMDGTKIKVVSEQGKGSQFICIIPFKIALSKTPVNAHQMLGETPTELADKHFNVLLVEDNIISRYAIKTVLEKFNCKIDEAGSASAAWEALQSNAYDFVLMDIGLPDISGIELTKKIRAKLSETLPIIALTADNSAEIKKQAKKAGMTHFLSKPIARNSWVSLLVLLSKEHVQ